jgi:5-carboxymethyl-2-hydroxymuconate isomerase
LKLLSFEVQGRSSFGAVRGDGIVELRGRLAARLDCLQAVLGAGALDRARELVARASPDFAQADVRWLPPVPQPEKIFCIGVNYAERNEEYRDGSAAPKYPSVFMRTPGSLVGHRAPLLLPLESRQLDYEGEIAIVIGRTGRRIPVEQALAHIAGLTCMNEGTVRDWVRHGKFNVTQGKNFDASGAIGPWLVTADEFAGYDDLRVITRVNGETRQDDTTARLMFPFAQLIHYLSLFTTLRPGDIISTGTPTGAGVRFDPPRYLQAGDTVEVEVSGIGVLSNTVIAEGEMR